MMFDHKRTSCLDYYISRDSREPFYLWRIVAILLSIAVITSVITVGDAQLLSAYEQAYGHWNIRLRKNNIFGRRWYLETLEYDNSEDWENFKGDNSFKSGRGDDSRSISTTMRDSKTRETESDLQLLFPRVPVLHVERSTTISEQAEQEQKDCEDDAGKSQHETQAQASLEKKSQSLQKRYQYSAKPVRSVSCVLNLEKNGKFTLYLVDENKSSNYNKHTLHANTPQITQKYVHPNSFNHQPLRGEWYLSPNPYCVTDRQYDTLTLLSEPRMRRVNSSESTMIEKATVELRCKVWGRYGVGAIREKIGCRHGRGMGRMTHGTVMIVQEQLVNGGEVRSEKKCLIREIVGTFKGRAIVDTDSSSDKKNSIQLNQTGMLVGNEEDEDVDGHLGLKDDFGEF